MAFNSINMVLTFKKDWSADLNYSSLAEDQKVRVECGAAGSVAGLETSGVKQRLTFGS